MTDRKDTFAMEQGSNRSIFVDTKKSIKIARVTKRRKYTRNQSHIYIN